MEMKDVSKKLSVVLSLDDPTPIAFLNVYEEGDVWVKIKGCEECPIESRKKCCGNCPLLTPDGQCSFHLESKKNSKKPIHCIVKPYPNDCLKFCSLEFKCIKGSKEGKIRKVKEPGNIFR